MTSTTIYQQMLWRFPQKRTLSYPYLRQCIPFSFSGFSLTFKRETLNINNLSEDKLYSNEEDLRGKSTGDLMDGDEDGLPNETSDGSQDSLALSKLSPLQLKIYYLVEEPRGTFVS